MYATVADIQARMPQFQLTATTKPSITDAAVFIADIEALINAALSNYGYALPITSAIPSSPPVDPPQALTTLRLITVQGAIAQVLYARAAAVGGDDAVKTADRAQKLFDSYLTQLAPGGGYLELIDAMRTGDAVSKPAAGLVRGLATETGDEFYPENTYPRTWLDQLF